MAGRFSIEFCAICRGDLFNRCFECQGSGEDRVCQGYIHNAVCSHVFHTECIKRWINTRACCPLCNASWIFPQGLNLKQLAAVKFVDDEEKLLELIACQELDPSIYNILDSGLRHYRLFKLPLIKQRLLAHAFAQYLDVNELEKLLIVKRTKPHN